MTVEPTARPAKTQQVPAAAAARVAKALVDATPDFVPVAATVAVTREPRAESEARAETAEMVEPDKAAVALDLLAAIIGPGKMDSPETPDKLAAAVAAAAAVAVVLPGADKTLAG